MQSDETAANSLLYRANSKKSDANNANNLLSPIREGSMLFRPDGSSKFVRSINTATSKASQSGTPRKSIKIVKPETIKRANNDTWMASAIGDLQWLKNSLKISPEIVFDKNGYAHIHLACIHGRLNIIKYLIEEQSVNIDLPSSQGWCPIHLCINNNIGSKAVDCLKYLIAKGANINVKNNDGTYPLHIAASEGQVECLRILLDLRADTKIKDNRGQTALDLAKLWGHRYCAKYLNNEMWCNEKKQLFVENKLEKEKKTQKLLIQIQTAYEFYFEDKELADKSFDDWLMTQLNVQEDSSSEVSPRKNQSENLKSESKSTIKIFSVTSSIIDSSVKQKAVSNESEAQSIKSTNKLKPLANSSTPHTNWNFSTKGHPKTYIPNLNDFYPRDPYTNLPTDTELLFLNKQLKGQTVEKVRALISKDLSDVDTNSETPGRPVYYKPKHILDAQTKINLESPSGPIDQAGLNINSGDPNSFAYKQAKNYIIQSRKSSTANAVDNIKKQLLDDSPNSKVVQKNQKVHIC